MVPLRAKVHLAFKFRSSGQKKEMHVLTSRISFGFQRACEVSPEIPRNTPILPHG